MIWHCVQYHIAQLVHIAQQYFYPYSIVVLITWRWFDLSISFILRITDWTWIQRLMTIESLVILKLINLRTCLIRKQLPFWCINYTQNSLHLNNIFTGCLMKFFLAFSVYSNGKKILSTKKTAGTLGAVNGVRVLSISWVILGHIFAFIIGVVCKSRWW